MPHSYHSSAVGTPQKGLQRSDSVVGKLHQDVVFDENDFLDDDEIDQEIANHMDYGSNSTTTLPSASLQPTTPKLSSMKKNLTSSFPIPWSSSPLNHKPQPPNTIPAQKNHIVYDLTQEDSEELSYPKLPEAEPEPVKRGRLPWQGANGQDLPKELSFDREHYQKGRGFNSKVHEPGPAEPPEHIKRMIEKRKRIKRDNAPSETPASTGGSDSPYPWNKTASAVKEEQKKLRQQANQNKKKTEASDAATEVFKTSSKAKKKVSKVFLSDEQKKVLNLVTLEGKSVFFTGSAGTGKSVLMREIIASLKDKYKREADRVAVTASTGLAACNVGGVTLHSFAGIGLGKEPAEILIKKIKKNAKAKTRWLRTKVLVIDEISMVDGELFDKLEAIARNLRNSGRPFGGIQLVVTGDFFQLPPVPESGKAAKFAFDATTWPTSIGHTIGLTQVFRQKDPVFANLLNEMRIGKLSASSLEIFRKLNRPLKTEDDFAATELFPTRVEVERANEARLRNLHGNIMHFDATDTGTCDQEQRTKLLQNCMAPQRISLKKGAQVMLIKNIDENLVNGSVGKVMCFMDERQFDHYNENEDDYQAMHSDPGDAEASRQKIKQFMNSNDSGPPGRIWPLIRFKLADGSTRDLLCQQEAWKIELPNGEIQAQRNQIPLILAWALSIHKAQGQTLERVKVDLGKIFEKGQAYVALSRATTQEGLQISRFDPKKVMAHDRVRQFYDSLYGIDQAAAQRQQVGSTSRFGGHADEDFLAGAFEDDFEAQRDMYM
jgi:ATP-dependent DNA helicase PIF1